MIMESSDLVKLEGEEREKLMKREVMNFLSSLIGILAEKMIPDPA